MATTVLQGFKELSQNLEITNLQEKTVSIRQASVRAVVENDMIVLDSFLTGSYRRNTMIAPLSEADVDIFVVLDPKYYSQNDQIMLLDKIKLVLKKSYPKTPKISRNGRAVTIVFSDFVVDVIPSFFQEGGGYVIPDSRINAWISTDPKKHVELWSTYNKQHGGDLIPLIKMLKGWNKLNNSTLRSFHLECMILKGLEYFPILDFPSGVIHALNRLKSQIYTQIPDPAGYGNIDNYLTEYELANISIRLDAACALSLEAEWWENFGKTEKAFEKWRLIFSDYFPTYG